MSDKMTATDYKKIEAREKRKKERKYLKHLKDLVESINPFRSSAGSYDKKHQFTNEPENIAFYRKIWRGKRSKYIKKQCNDKVRRDEEELYQRGAYKKVGDFWWDYI